MSLESLCYIVVCNVAYSIFRLDNLCLQIYFYKLNHGFHIARMVGDYVPDLSPTSSETLSAHMETLKPGSHKS